MSQCKHVVPADVCLLDSQLEDLKALPSYGGTCDIICMRLKTAIPPTDVAIKCFRPPNTSYQDLVDVEKKIKNELKIWTLVNNSPNVARFLGVVTKHDSLNGKYVPPWPVCEYYTNNRIDQFVHRQNANASQRFQLLAGIIRGLAHIHSMSIIHGDLKATNVAVSDSGTIAKICDFGSSLIGCRCYDGPEDQAGTAQWDSPELGEGKSRTASSDIWAFGCVALETQFSKFPYHLDDFKTYNMQRRKLPPAAESSVDLLASPISRAVWDIMQRCWQWDPIARPDAQSLLTDFEALELDNMIIPETTCRLM